MGTFKALPQPGEFPPFKQQVFLNGNLRSDIFCLSVNLNPGINGSSADFMIPSLTWDGDKKALQGKTVTVYAGFETQSHVPVFIGNVNAVSGGVPENYIQFQAQSFLATFGNSTYIGPSHNYEIEYPTTAYRNSVPTVTGWTCNSILRDILGSSTRTWKGGGGSIDSDKRALIKLGSLAALNTDSNNVPVGDIAFSNTTLADALTHLLERVGTVSFWSEPRGFAEYLQFYTLADPSAPEKVIIVAREGDDARYSNVLSLTNEESIDDVKTCFCCAGDFVRCTISGTTDHPTAPLGKGWNEELEEIVLLNPSASLKGTEGSVPDDLRKEYNAELAKVFRKYYLHDCQRRYVIADKINVPDGSTLPIQVWGHKTVKTLDPETNVWTGTPSAIPTRLKADLHLKEGYFILNEPAVDVIESHINPATNDPVDTNAPIVVGISFTICGDKIKHLTDNDATVVNINGLSLQENISNDTFGYEQFTNIGFPLIDSDGNEHTFSTLLLEAGEQTWIESGLAVVKDDRRALRYFTENSLREKNRVRIGYTITIPYFTQAYRIGDRIRVVGQDDFQYGTHQITNVAYNLTSNHSTTITTDNSVPLINNSILGK